MRVKLSYFKTSSGKYYSEGEFHTEKKHMFEVFEQARVLLDTKCLPGLVHGHSDFIVLAEAPEHELNVPHLILPKGWRADG